MATGVAVSTERVNYAHEAVMEGSFSHTHSLGQLHTQAKEIIYYVNRYIFFCRKGKQRNSHTQKVEVHIIFGNAAYCIKPL